MSKNHTDNHAKKHIVKRILWGIAGAILCFVLFMCIRILYSMFTPISYKNIQSAKNISAESNGIYSENSTEEFSAGSSVTPSSWMSFIDNDLRLSEFTIPGTHDTATEHIMFPYSYSCQDTSIDDQMYAGFRFFDLRLQKAENGDFAMHHGNGICKKESGLNADTLYFSDICSRTYDFLAENPSECVIFLLSCDDNGALADFIANEIETNGQYWFTDNVNPTLGEVRGKIVTMTRDAYEATGYGIGVVYTATPEDGPYESGTISCEARLLYQDLYTLGVNDKWDAFDALLSDCPADENTFSVNYLSCASGLFNLPSPKENARTLNRRLMQRELPEGNYGIILVDFASQELAEKLYMTNFGN